MATSKTELAIAADTPQSESARDRLARLEAELKDKLRSARREARREIKAEQDQAETASLQPTFDSMVERLAEIEQETGKIFRSFSFYYKFGKDSEKPEIKFNYSLVRPRGESTDD